MRRFLAITFIAFYLLFSVGIQVEVDRCCEKIASLMGFDLKEESHTCCTAHSCCDVNPSKDNDHNDCDLVDINLIIEGEQNLPSQIQVPDLSAEFDVISIVNYDSFDVDCTTQTEYYVESDPPDPLPLYLLHSSLTYYG